MNAEKRNWAEFVQQKLQRYGELDRQLRKGPTTEKLTWAPPYRDPMQHTTPTEGAGTPHHRVPHGRLFRHTDGGVVRVGDEREGPTAEQGSDGLRLRGTVLEVLAREVVVDLELEGGHTEYAIPREHFGDHEPTSGDPIEIRVHETKGGVVASVVAVRSEPPTPRSKEPLRRPFEDEDPWEE